MPTIADRIIQDILRMTLEPITEYHASDNSYGFRPKRCCQDAIAHLFDKLSAKNGKQCVVEGDIAGCFDNISHDHILNTLKSWHVTNNIINIIRKMLKSKIFFDDKLHDADTGTPQGGTLSPMLANVALTALDNYCYKEYGYKYWDNKKKKRVKCNPIVRYADDFVIMCKSEQEAIDIKEKIAMFLMDNVGLELSDEKTRITHISEGFNFLGFNIRKYTEKSHRSKYHKEGKLLIRPQKEKVINFLRKIREALDNNKTAKQKSIINMLNPMLQGFGMYYRFVVSKETFTHIRGQLWEKLWRWTKKRHPKKPKWWIIKKYFTTENKRKWVFKAETGDEILCIDTIPIVRFVKIKSGMRVHAGDKATKEYWEKRIYTNALSQIYSIKVAKLFKKQKGICPYCGSPITKDDIVGDKIHVHHMLPSLEGGSEKLNNLRLLHLDCHKEIHSVISLKQMAYWFKRGLNYINQKCILDIKTRPEAYAVV